MIVGSISENKEIEKRISITPDLAKKYINLGFKVILEKNYGSHIGFNDKDYESEGCEFNDRSEIINKSTKVQ